MVIKNFRDKIICSDVDGTFLDFYGPFEAWCRNNSDHGDSIITKQRHYADDDFIIRMELMKDFWESAELLSLPFDEGSEKVLNFMHDNCELHIVSALPKQYQDKRAVNLEPINYHDLRCVGDNDIGDGIKESYIINDLKPDIMIEDKPSMVEAFHEAGIEVYWPRRMYNNHLKVGTPFHSWTHLGFIMFRYEYLKTYLAPESEGLTTISKV